MTTTIVATRAPLDLCCRPEAMGRSTLAGVALDDVTGVYVGALPPRVPGLRPDAPASAARRLREQQAADGDRDAVCAMLAYLTLQGRPVLNPPIGGTLLQNKLEHLSLAAAVGLRVAPTVYGDQDAAQALREAGPAVDKPARAWTPTVPAAATLPPGLMRQRRIAGVPARVLVLDGALLNASRVEGTTAVDHRLDPAFTAGEAGYRPTEVPADVARHLVELVPALGLRFAGVDFLIDDEGHWWFLEANASPVWVEQADRTGTDVAAALLGALLA